jgi:hypothetical protein
MGKITPITLFVHKLESLVGGGEELLRLTFLTVGNSVISTEWFSIVLRDF